MDNVILKKIDNVILSIKEKCDSAGTSVGDIFIILTFEILRVEISQKKITEYTISAVNQIASNTSHTDYYRDFRELYNQLHDCYIDISELDSRFYDADLPRLVSFEVTSWQKYISKASSSLLNTLPLS